MRRWPHRAVRRHDVRDRDAGLDGGCQGEPGAWPTTDLPLDERGRLKATAAMQVVGFEDAWGAGDGTAVPDLTSDDGRRRARRTRSTPCARRRCLADNIIARLRGFPPTDYKHKYVGSVAGLGLYKGVANVYGVKVKGVLAWFMHRTYHVSRVPTFNRKAAGGRRLDAGAVLQARDRVAVVDA